MALKTIPFKISRMALERVAADGNMNGIGVKDSVNSTAAASKRFIADR
jgi:hypothetical protein